jgi:hypothetical protein
MSVNNVPADRPIRPTSPTPGEAGGSPRSDVAGGASSARPASPTGLARAPANPAGAPAGQRPRAAVLMLDAHLKGWRDTTAQSRHLEASFRPPAHVEVTMDETTSHDANLRNALAEQFSAMKAGEHGAQFAFHEFSRGLFLGAAGLPVAMGSELATTTAELVNQHEDSKSKDKDIGVGKTIHILLGAHFGTPTARGVLDRHIKTLESTPANFKLTAEDQKSAYKDVGDFQEKNKLQNTLQAIHASHAEGIARLKVSNGKLSKIIADNQAMCDAHPEGAQVVEKLISVLAASANNIFDNPAPLSEEKKIARTHKKESAQALIKAQLGDGDIYKMMCVVSDAFDIALADAAFDGDESHPREVTEASILEHANTLLAFAGFSQRVVAQTGAAD